MKQYVPFFSALAFLAVACAAPSNSPDPVGDGDGDGDSDTSSGGALVSGSGGALTTGSGGAPTTSSGGSPAGSSGGAPSTTISCSGTVFSPVDGYADNGTFCGYFWTASNGEGETITPPCGTGDCFMGNTICASGSIPAVDAEASSYPGIMIGWNVAQDAAGTESTWASSGSGITVNFDTGGATGEVRILVQAGGQDYCAAGVSSGAPLSWSDFSVECWDGGAQSPTLTAGTAVTAIGVQINGADAPQTFTDFCVSGISAN